MFLSSICTCTVIFDGCDNGPSTNDIKRQVRGTTLSQIVIVNLNKKVNTSQEKFLKMVKIK